jgi:hypothetical protein
LGLSSMQNIPAALCLSQRDIVLPTTAKEALWAEGCCPALSLVSPLSHTSLCSFPFFQQTRHPLDSRQLFLLSPPLLITLSTLTAKWLDGLQHFFLSYFFFFFFAVLGLEFRAFTLSHSTSPFL